MFRFGSMMDGGHVHPWSLYFRTLYNVFFFFSIEGKIEKKGKGWNLLNAYPPSSTSRFHMCMLFQFLSRLLDHDEECVVGLLACLG